MDIGQGVDPVADEETVLLQRARFDVERADIAVVVFHEVADFVLVILVEGVLDQAGGKQIAVDGARHGAADGVRRGAAGEVPDAVQIEVHGVSWGSFLRNRCRCGLVRGR